MFDRVGVDVIHVHSEIFGVADCMFQEPWLPDSAPSMALLSGFDGHVLSAGSKKCPSESLLQYRNTGRIVSVAIGHSPDHVKVFRQQDNCLSYPWSLDASLFNR